MPSPWKPKVKYPVRVEQTKQILAMSPSLPIRVLSKLDLVIVTTTKTGTILSTRCRDEIILAVSKSTAAGPIEVPIIYFSFGKILREVLTDIEDPKMRMFIRSPVLMAVGLMDMSCRLCGIDGPSEVLSSQDWEDLEGPVRADDVPTRSDVFNAVADLSKRFPTKDTRIEPRPIFRAAARA